MCFTDEDGDSYLYWGFGRPGVPYIAKLKENMTELAEKPLPVDYGANDFFEAPFLHKYKENIILLTINLVLVKLVMLLVNLHTDLL